MGELQPQPVAIEVYLQHPQSSEGGDASRLEPTVVSVALQFPAPPFSTLAHGPWPVACP